MHPNIGYTGRQSVTHWKNSNVTSQTSNGLMTLSSALGDSKIVGDSSDEALRQTVNLWTSVSPMGAVVAMVFHQETDLYRWLIDASRIRIRLLPMPHKGQASMSTSNALSLSSEEAQRIQFNHFGLARMEDYYVSFKEK
ncbi:hypothetical protein HAX54_018630 [Datura stramonium]|uniref:Uncharacterized protein n=1 Tax=Datura stramonium TaxID=4076 RepID=A0ABS8UPW6_DATST|nr:hypothetical protein [Datura stramonium]